MHVYITRDTTCVNGSFTLRWGVAVKRGRPGNVAFIHVPAGRSDEDMNVAVEIWKAVSGALVDHLEKERR